MACRGSVEFVGTPVLGCTLAPGHCGHPGRGVPTGMSIEIVGTGVLDVPRANTVRPYEWMSIDGMYGRGGFSKKRGFFAGVRCNLCAAVL